MHSLGTVFPEPCGFPPVTQEAAHEKPADSQGSCVVVWRVVWAGDKDPVSRLPAPAPPLPVSQARKGWAPHSSSLCILSCLRPECTSSHRGWKGIFTLTEPSDPKTPGGRFRKPALSTRCTPLCSRAVTPAEITLVFIAKHALRCSAGWAFHRKYGTLSLPWAGGSPNH